MEKLFEQFVKEKRFFKGVSPKTVIWYRTSWKAFDAALASVRRERLNKSAVLPRIAELQSAGVSNISINTYAKAQRIALRNEGLP